MAIAPWIMQAPFDALDAIRSGTSAGLQLRGQDQQANDAAQRLRLSYDELAAQREQQLRNDARLRESLVAQNALRKTQADSLSAYRNQQQSNDAARLMDAEKKQAGLDASKEAVRRANQNFFLGLNSGKDPATLMAENPDADHSVVLPYVQDALKTRQAQGGTGLTKGTQAKLEQAQMDADNTFQIGQKLAGLLTYGNTGVAGNLSRAGDAVMGLVPGHKVGSSTEAKTLAIDFGAKLTRALRSDGNIAEPERKQIMEALPRPQDWSESSSSAKSKLATALEQAGQISRDSALKRNIPITPHFLLPVEIREMLASGKINGKQASAMMENNAWRLINTLKDESQR